jgi:hypothetical protein
VGYGLRAATLTCGWAFLVLGLLALLYGLGRFFDGTAGYFRFGIAEISKKKNLHCSGFFPAQRKKEKRFVSSNLNIPQEKKA